MRIVGLTGGIATGKSTVTAQLREEGLAVVDLDVVAAAVVQKGRWGHRRVVAAFGPKGFFLTYSTSNPAVCLVVLGEDGEVDRAALRERMVADPNVRRRLNAATHLPIAVTMLQELFAYWLEGRGAVVLDAPLLFETGLHRICSRIVTVACAHQSQVQRLMRRDGVDEASAEDTIKCQMPLELKVQKAQIVLRNDSTVTHLQAESKQLARQLLSEPRGWLQLLAHFTLRPLLAWSVGIAKQVASRLHTNARL